MITRYPLVGKNTVANAPAPIDEAAEDEAVATALTAVERKSG